MIDDGEVRVRVIGGDRALVTLPAVMDATAAHGVRRALLHGINALPDHIVDIDFDLSDIEVLDDAGTAALGAARRHAFLLGLRPGHPTTQHHTDQTPTDTGDKLLGDTPLRR
ncbi:STAS domain-containing protein [Embleya sp. NPDC001921]